MLCGMTIIRWFLADFDGCKLDGHIVMVLVAGLHPIVVVSIPAVIVYKYVSLVNCLLVENLYSKTFSFFLSSWRSFFLFQIAKKFI